MTGNVSAQMTDGLGGLLIDSQLTGQDFQSIGKGQQALNRVRFQQDLAALVAEVQTSYFGNYAGLDKSALEFRGFNGLNWNITASDDGGFYVIFNNLDNQTCFSCQGNALGARRVEINNGGSCQSTSNQVKLLF